MESRRRLKNLYRSKFSFSCNKHCKISRMENSLSKLCLFMMYIFSLSMFISVFFVTSFLFLCSCNVIVIKFDKMGVLKRLEMHFLKQNIKCGDKYLFTFTYVQNKQHFSKICPHTLLQINRFCLLQSHEVSV